MSQRIYLRFYEELNDYLPAGKRKVRFEHDFDGDPSILDLLREFNIPPGRVDLVLAEGTSVDFSHRLRDGEWISLYPVFEHFNIRSLSRLRPFPLRDTKFLAGKGLRGLVRDLRLCGFDTRETECETPEDLVQLSESECRILLLRAAGRAPQIRASRIWWIRAARPRLQLLEILEELDLYQSVVPLSRCPSCNQALSEAREMREKPAGRVYFPPLPPQCGGCGRPFSKGPHLNRLMRWAEGILGSHTGRQ